MPRVEDFWDESDGSISLSGLDSSTEQDSVGQAFTTGPAPIGRLDSISFEIATITGSPTGDVFAALFTHTGVYGTSSVPGRMLAKSSPVDASTLSASSWQTWDMSASNYNLSASTQYIAACMHPGSGTTDFFALTFDQTGSHDGILCERQGPNATWANPVSSWDLVFRVYSSTQVIAPIAIYR